MNEKKTKKKIGDASLDGCLRRRQRSCELGACKRAANRLKRRGTKFARARARQIRRDEYRFARARGQLAAAAAAAYNRESKRP